MRAIHLRHCQIENDQVRRVPREQFHGLLTILNGVDQVIVFLENGSGYFARKGVVISDQNGKLLYTIFTLHVTLAPTTWGNAIFYRLVFCVTREPEIKIKEIMAYPQWGGNSYSL